MDKVRFIGPWPKFGLPDSSAKRRRMSGLLPSVKGVADGEPIGRGAAARGVGFPRRNGFAGGRRRITQDQALQYTICCSGRSQQYNMEHLPIRPIGLE